MNIIMFLKGIIIKTRVFDSVAIKIPTWGVLDGSISGRAKNPIFGNAP